MPVKSYPHLPFEFTTESTNDGKCWYDLQLGGLLRKSQINKIKDDDIEGSLMTAAIPSPLARMSLFKSAFDYFNEQLERSTSGYSFSGPNAKIVSDCLDFLQLLFENQDETRIRVKPWNIQTQLNGMLTSINPKHQHLGESLKPFFAKLPADFQVINLIYYVTTDNSEILIGGSSPYTLVYTSPNWRDDLKRENASETIGELRSTNRQDIFFDDKYFALENRSQDFKHALYSISSQQQNAHLPFALFTKNVLAEETPILQQPSSAYGDYKINERPLQLGGVVFKKIKPLERIDSGLRIAPDENISGYNVSFGDKMPLVFVNGMHYEGEYFGTTPYSDSLRLDANVDIQNRVVPGTSLRHPVVTTDDFFYDTLIKVPFIVNSEHFTTGNIPTNKSRNEYLLPLRPLYFQFFDKEHLNHRLQIEFDNNEIVYQLRVPVGKNSQTITLEKRYTISTGNQDDDAAVGVDFIELKGTLNIFPLLRYVKRTADEEIPMYNSYNVMSFFDTKVKDVHLDFWKTKDFGYLDADSETSLLNYAKPLSNKRKTNSSYGTAVHYAIKTDFDVIAVKYTDNSGRTYVAHVVPKFKNCYGQYKGFCASIDFGTTNTHVVVKTPEKGIATLSYTENDNYVGFLHEKGTNYFDFSNMKNSYTEAYTKEYLPHDLEEAMLGFPMRTVSLNSTMETVRDAKKPFLYSNIAFFFENDNTTFNKDFNNYKYVSNLKTLFDSNPEGGEPAILVTNFIQELFLLLKAKIIGSGYDLEDVKIIWSYPSTSSFLQQLSEIFEECSLQVFGTKINSSSKNLVTICSPISESIAPFVYLRNNADAHENITGININIDIGGGTTDISICDDTTGKPQLYTSSIKLAGNDIWGSGLEDGKKDNGFVNAWIDLNFEKLNSTTSELAYKVFKANENNIASDKVSLLFKLNNELEFTSIFTNRQRSFQLLKYPLYYHFGAILYYTAKLLESKQLYDLNKITFTGKGSGYLDILFDNSADLKKFIELFFAEYSDNKNIAHKTRISGTVERIANAKEITAIGAIESIGINVSAKYGEFPVEEFTYKIKKQKDFGAQKSKDDRQIWNELKPEVESILEILLGAEVSGYIKDKLKIDDTFKDEFFSKYALVLSSQIKDGEVYNDLNLTIFSNSYVKTIEYYKEHNTSRLVYPFKNAIYQMANSIFKQITHT